MFSLGLSTASCALPPWIGHAPVFPSDAADARKTWEIPLYEPLTGLGPKVAATVCGPARTGTPRACEEVLLYVDSGSSHSALPAATFARLGVETSGSRFATIEDAAAGQERVVEVAMPEQQQQLFALDCKGLALLDVNPVLAAVRPMTADVEARWTLGSRRLRLK